jgi:hypothetical protein
MQGLAASLAGASKNAEAAARNESVTRVGDLPQSGNVVGKGCAPERALSQKLGDRFGASEDLAVGADVFELHLTLGEGQFRKIHKHAGLAKGGVFNVHPRLSKNSLEANC